MSVFLKSWLTIWRICSKQAAKLLMTPRMSSPAERISSDYSRETSLLRQLLVRTGRTSERMARINYTLVCLDRMAKFTIMNFKNMPELNWVWGYPFALFLIVLIGSSGRAGSNNWDIGWLVSASMSAFGGKADIGRV
jgi:hypothetical protein